MGEARRMRGSMPEAAERVWESKAVEQTKQEKSRRDKMFGKVESGEQGLYKTEERSATSLRSGLHLR